jgi:hypothetical protein
VAELITISQCPAQPSGTRRVGVTHDAVQVAESEKTTGLDMNPSDLSCGFSIIGAMSLICRVEDL